MTYARCQRAIVCLVFAVAVAGSGCADSTGVDEIVSVAIAPGDTTIWNGDVITLEATAETRAGAVVPDSVIWAVSDSTVLLLSGAGAQITVTALASGKVEIVAQVDGLADTAEVTAVTPGDIRWSTMWQYPGGGTPALDGHGRIHILRSGAQEELIALDLSGVELFSAPTCDAGTLAPSVTADGAAYLTGIACTNRHGPDGTVAWTQPFGDLDSGVAVDADGSVIVVHSFADIYMSRFSITGAEVWRDTLAVSPGVDVRAAPAIAANGEIYVPWRAPANTLSRFGPDGTLRWSVPVSGQVLRSSPALVDDRIAVTYVGDPDGLAVYDTSGALIWESTFEAGSAVSSPVIDGEGNHYVQTIRRLISYDAAGMERWAAASLGCGQCAFAVGAPSLLVGNQLVVGCDAVDSGAAVCAVDTTDGSLIWRSSSIGSIVGGSPGVAEDGTVYVVGRSGVIALWNKVAPLTEGWPTEGGSMQRLRRQ